MTGFEVVGVLLALYPVLIDGIRLYQKIQSGQLVSDLLKDVLEQQIIFHNWIGFLLLHSVPVEELEGLLDPTSRTFARWKDDPRLHQVIEQSYGSIKASFLLETLKDAHEELEGIKTDLATLKPSTDGVRSRFASTFKSVRYSREGSNLKERLKRLQKLNARVGNVCQVSKILHPRMVNYPSISPVKFNVSLPEHAANIHKAIQTGYRCQCTEPHLAKLCLPRLLESGPAESPAQTRPYFEILFSVQDEEDHQFLEYQRLSSSELDLSMVLSETSINSQPETDSLTQSPSNSTATLTRRDSIFSKLNSNVSTNSSVTKLTAAKNCSFVVTEASAHPAGDIVDICSVVNQNDVRQIVQGVVSSLGTLPMVGPSRYELQIPMASQITATSTMTSLEDIFIENDFRLARRHRVALALRLSLAIVQFSVTPWIKSQWLWEDFSILDLHERRLDDVRLYVAHQFLSTRNATKQSSKWPDSVLAVIPGEQALIRLGCALVELAFGKRLSRMAGSPPSSSDSALSDFVMAHTMVESGRLRDEESEAYHNVVRICLKQEVPHGDGWKSLNSRDPSFQHDAMKAIVEPLHQIWKKEWGISRAQTVC